MASRRGWSRAVPLNAVAVEGERHAVDVRPTRAWNAAKHFATFPGRTVERGRYE